MREPSTVGLVRPESVDDIFLTYRAVPLAIRRRTLFFVGPAGLATVDVLGRATHIRPAHPQGDFDEVVAFASGVVGLIFHALGCELVLFGYRDSGLEEVTRTTIQLGREHEGADVIADSRGRLTFFVRSDSEIRILGSMDPTDIRVITARQTIPASADQEIVAFVPGLALLREDHGPDGWSLILKDLGRAITETFRGFHWSSLGSRLYFEDTRDERSRVHLRGGPVDLTVDVPGPVTGIAATDWGVLISVIDGGDEVVLAFCDEGDPRPVRLDLPVGKKTFGVAGDLIAIQGYEGSIELVEAERATFDASRADSEQVEGGPGGPASEVRPPDPLIRRTERTCVGTILHLHGGPESFEVPEPRFFGLPQHAFQNGWDWIGLNYPGSLSPDPRWTRLPRRRWRAAILADVGRGVDLARGPLVLVGWSFGAAVALACASSFERIAGLVLGGAPGGILEHSRRAADLDPRHRKWFDERFDVEGDDAEFFNGTSGFRLDVNVLELHGKSDDHCPADLTDAVAEAWRNRGNPWRRLPLPGEDHYATGVADARVIAEAARRFLAEMAAPGGRDPSS